MGYVLEGSADMNEKQYLLPQIRETIATPGGPGIPLVPGTPHGPGMYPGSPMSPKTQDI